MFQRNDETLIKQALSGKKSAWQALVKRYEKPIYNYAYRMVNNPDDAMDLLQDIFIAVYRNLSGFRGQASFKNWLYKIAHYRCIEFYRRKRPTQSLDESPEYAEEQLDDCPTLQLEQGQQAKQLLALLQQLSVKQKMVIEMKFFQHCTFDEIAHQLGESTNTIKSRFYSALDKLKSLMEVTQDEAF